MIKSKGLELRPRGYEVGAIPISKGQGAMRFKQSGHLHLLFVSCQGEGEASPQEVVEGGRTLGRRGQVVCLFVSFFVCLFGRSISSFNTLVLSIMSGNRRPVIVRTSTIFTLTITFRTEQQFTGVGLTFRISQYLDWK